MKQTIAKTVKKTAWACLGRGLTEKNVNLYCNPRTHYKSVLFFRTIREKKPSISLQRSTKDTRKNAQTTLYKRIMEIQGFNNQNP
jgi:hypothetical protein